MSNPLEILFFFVILFQFANGVSVVLRIKAIDNHKERINVGKDEPFSLVTDFFNEENVIDETELKEEKLEFYTKIRDNRWRDYYVKCRLWQPSHQSVRLICYLDPNSYQLYTDVNITFDNSVINVGNYQLNIQQEEFYFLQIKRLDFALPFLYSDFQNYNLSLNQSSITLKFKVDTAENYNNELLYIYGEKNNYAILDNCEVHDKELHCVLQNSIIEKILTINGESFKIGIIHDKIGIKPQDNILNISIYYENITKTEISVGFTKYITYTSEVGAFFGFETDYTEKIDFITDYVVYDNDIKCQFKSNREGPLLYLCSSPYKKNNFSLYNETEEKRYETIHFKYNIVVKPYSIPGEVSIANYGTNIMLIYPEKLDFNTTDAIVITVRYIMANPYLSENIKINPDSDNLICKNLEGMKKCLVPISHFYKKKSGIYRTHHSNHLGNLSIYYESTPIEVILSEEDFIPVVITNEGNERRMDISEDSNRRAAVYFITNNSEEMKIFNDYEIEEKMKFDTDLIQIKENPFIKNNYSYPVTCQFWKPTDLNMRIFCKSYGTLYDGNSTINSTLFYYNGYKIYIISLMDYPLNIHYNMTFIPFIYSKKQTINVEEGKDSYEIKFKYLLYRNDRLYLFKKEKEETLTSIAIPVEDNNKCNITENDISCIISKEQIENILAYSGEVFQLKYLPTLFPLENSFDITINYYNKSKKEDIYVGIKKLLEKNICKGCYAAYETNITSLSKIISNQFIYKKDETTEFHCVFKKDENMPLLLLCKLETWGEYSLGEITEEIRLDNISIKYNFIIQPVNNSEIVTVEIEGSSILIAYPKTLDFYFTDSIEVIYFTPELKYSISKLNLDSTSELSNSRNNNLVSCTITKSHFEGKQSGNYYAHYRIGYESIGFEYPISYELSPFEIILPKFDEILIWVNYEDNKDVITIGKNGALFLTTKFIDTENKFNSSDINMTTFSLNFTGSDKDYISNCHFWKPSDKRIRLICKFEENIESEFLKLPNKSSFKYNEKDVSIISLDKFNIKQLNSSIAFLYSDDQTIDITNEKEEYELIFNKEIYNNEPLVLYKDSINMRNVFLNCSDEKKEIKCKIKRDILFGIFSYSTEKYYLSQLTENEGLLIFDKVSMITFNTKNIQRKSIDLEITKLLTNYIDKNSFIALETNIEDFPIVTTKNFGVPSDLDEDYHCILKKHSNLKSDKLLLLCNAEKSKDYFKLKYTFLFYDINIMYNFTIKKVEINEKYVVSTEEGVRILSVYPDSLDLTTNDTAIIRYHVEDPKKLKGIKLNIDSSSELECKDINNIKECIVNKTHFKKSGYYYTYYTNNFDSKSIAYEIPRIKVTVIEENYTGVIVGCVIGGLVAIAFFVWRYIRKKNSNNIDQLTGNNEGMLNEKSPLV